MKNTINVALFYALLCCAANVYAVPPATRYTVTEISPTNVTESNRPRDLNNSGVGVGTMSSGSAYGDRALVFANGATQKLGTLPTDPGNTFLQSFALGINNLGNVVGNSTYGSNGSTTHGFFYSGGVMTDIGAISGALSEANAVNDANQVAGRSSIAGGFAPIRWQNGQMINLGSLGGTNGSAFDINASGNTVGFSTNASGSTRAFFWHDLNTNGQSDPGEMISLGILSGYLTSVATSVNNLNEVVGNLGTSQRAFYWKDMNSNNLSDPGEMTLLPLMSGMVLTNATGINNAGDIVGLSRSSSSVNYATIWDDGIPYDLNTLLDLSPGQTVPQFTLAQAINDRGEILVTGAVPTGLGNKDRVYLLTPVPEPGVIALGCMVLLIFIVRVVQQRSFAEQK